MQKLRAQFQLENNPPVLTLQPVIGQRKSRPTEIRVGKDRKQASYVNGAVDDEARELRRFDHVREDRGRGGRGKKPHGGLTVSGEAAAKQSQKPFKQRTQKNDRSLPEGNPAAFRSWYVPDGVSTGPSNHRNAGPGAARGPGARGPGAGAHPGLAASRPGGR